MYTLISRLQLGHISNRSGHINKGINPITR